MRSRITLFVAGCFFFPLSRFGWGQGIDVSATLVVHGDRISVGDGHQKLSLTNNIVVWLSPLQPVDANPGQVHLQYRLTQRNKQFTPHLLVVPTGTSVEFPNEDPFFHNVFSLYNGKRFDLGLYEFGTSKSVRFDREGASYIFCNIHPQMGAIVLALSTPYYAISGDNGVIIIHHVPPGSYRMGVWSERAGLLNPSDDNKNIQIANTPMNLGKIAMKAIDSTLDNHKNKFGDDYVVPSTNPY